jgi:IS5 family transposase
MQKWINLNKIKQKQGEAKTKSGQKNGGKSYFGYKLHSIIDKDYVLIKKFKTILTSLSDFQVNFSEKKLSYLQIQGKLLSKISKL